MDGVFAPGDTYTIKVTAIGDTLSAYIDRSSTPVSTLVDSAFSMARWDCTIVSPTLRRATDSGRQTHLAPSVYRVRFTAQVQHRTGFCRAVRRRLSRSHGDRISAPKGRSVPVIPVEISELDRFGQMLGGDMLDPVEVGDRSGDAQHAIMGAGGKVHPANGHLESSFAALIKSTQGSQLGRRDLRVIEASQTLSIARGFNALPNFPR